MGSITYNEAAVLNWAIREAEAWRGAIKSESAIAQRDAKIEQARNIVDKMAVTADPFEIVSYRVIYYAEIGYVSGSTGEWLGRSGSILYQKPCTSHAVAMLAIVNHQNIVPEDRPNFPRKYRTNIDYTDWRIRRVEERMEG